MTDAQNQLQAYKKVLGSFANPRPRDVDTVESLNAQIDKVVSALDAIRPKRVNADVEFTFTGPQESLDLTTEPEDEPPARKRKRKKKDPNRQHAGGMDREA